MLTGDGCFCIVGDINKQQEELIMSLAFIIYLAGIVKDVCALLFNKAMDEYLKGDKPETGEK